MHLAEELQSIEPAVRRSPWAGYEHYEGYAVMMLPFSSGHQLGFRFFPINDFAPYISVWHRPPGGGWSIYNDAPSLNTACPRIWGPALDRAELTRIRVDLTGPNELHVEMDSPSLTWTMSVSAPPALLVLNAVSATLPLWTWRVQALLNMRAWIARRLLGMGDLQFSFVTPTHRDAVIIPERIYFIESSDAVLDGESLGEPVRLDANPTVGDVPLPTRATFVIGQAQVRIVDHEEYEETRRKIGAD